jgi:hypothetical protein
MTRPTLYEWHQLKPGYRKNWAWKLSRFPNERVRKIQPSAMMVYA